MRNVIEIRSYFRKCWWDSDVNVEWCDVYLGIFKCLNFIFVYDYFFLLYFWKRRKVVLVVL